MKTEKDAFRVWLTLRSSSLKTGNEIGRVIGLRANTKPLKTDQGFKPRTSFSLQSDLDVRDNAPLEAHVDWLLNRCGNKLRAIGDFLLEPGNSGEILVFISTSATAVITTLRQEQFQRFFGIGMDISIRVEFDGDGAGLPID